MTDDASARDVPPRSERSNGLSAAAWVSISDVDPRLTEPLLEALRDAGIPAYVAPSVGSAGPHMDLRRTDRLNERVWVDAQLRTEAERLLATTLPDLHASLEDERWAEIVRSLSADDGAGDVAEARWPAVEGATSSGADREPAYELLPPAKAEDDEHFIPPDPPLQPLDNPITRYGWIALLGGCLLLLVPSLIGKTLGTGWVLIAVAGIVGGFVTLIVRMKDTPPTDSGPDDGAVV